MEFYLNDLYLKEFLNNLETDYKNFIRLEDLKQEPELSGIFIKPNFLIDSLNALFEAVAWNKIITLFKAKSEASTCNICDQLCNEKAIQYEKILTPGCNCWYRWTFVNVSAYIRSGKSKKPWLCNNCKN